MIENAVIGIDSDFHPQEFHLETFSSTQNYDYKVSAFRKLSKIMRQQMTQFLENNNLKYYPDLEISKIPNENLNDAYFGKSENEIRKKTKKLCFISNTRKSKQIHNQEDLLEDLIEKFSDFEISVYNFEEFSVRSRIAETQNCDVLIGHHQNFLAHMFFMQPNSTVIEIFPYKYRTRTMENFVNIFHEY